MFPLNTQERLSASRMRGSEFLFLMYLDHCGLGWVYKQTSKQTKTNHVFNHVLLSVVSSCMVMSCGICTGTSLLLRCTWCSKVLSCTNMLCHMWLEWGVGYIPVRVHVLRFVWGRVCMRTSPLEEKIYTLFSNSCFSLVSSNMLFLLAYILRHVCRRTLLSRSLTVCLSSVLGLRLFHGVNNA